MCSVATVAKTSGWMERGKANDHLGCAELRFGREASRSYIYFVFFRYQADVFLQAVLRDLCCSDYNTSNTPPSPMSEAEAEWRHYLCSLNFPFLRSPRWRRSAVRIRDLSFAKTYASLPPHVMLQPPPKHFAGLHSSKRSAASRSCWC